MTKYLFDEFEEVSAKQWKQKIQFDLKGADYNEKMIWNSQDGVDVKPFYHPDEAPEPISLKLPSHWNICQKIYVVSTEKSNKNVQNILKKGAESLWFIISSEKIDLNSLFEEIDLKEIPIYLDFEFLSTAYLKKVNDFFAGKKAQVHLNLDPIGHLARTGNWYFSLKKDQEILSELLINIENFSSTISIDSGLFQNAGATIPQELAYTMAQANEYFNFHQENTVLQQPKAFSFKVSVGSNYFFEIAKLRALRLLFSKLAAEYNFSEKCEILAQPSKRNKTLYDFNTNLFRSTTECMSAILGGADSICNLPFDAIYHKENEFSSRIARNQLLILKEESYFEKVANPAEGSFYLESLTQQFAKKALDIFKEIERNGGFLKALKQGTIQKKIEESAAKEQQDFDAGKIVLIGTNTYQNPQDRMQHELELYPFLKQNPRKTLLPPILEKRLAEEAEQTRLKEEEN